MPWEGDTFYENYLSDDGETLRVDPSFIHWFRLVDNKHGFHKWVHGTEERLIRCVLMDLALAIVHAYLRAQPYAGSDDCLSLLDDVMNGLLAPGAVAKNSVALITKKNPRKTSLPDATPQVEYSSCASNVYR